MIIYLSSKHDQKLIEGTVSRLNKILKTYFPESSELSLEEAAQSEEFGTYFPLMCLTNEHQYKLQLLRALTTHNGFGFKPILELANGQMHKLSWPELVTRVQPFFLETIKREMDKLEEWVGDQCKWKNNCTTS